MLNPLLIALFASLPVSAQEKAPQGGFFQGWTPQLTDRIDVRYYRVDDLLPGFEDRRIHDYVEEVNRFNLMLSKGHFSVGAQVDQVGLFANRYILDGELYHSYQLYTPEIDSPFPDGFVNAEKVWLRWNDSWGELVAGDTYASFGRGIALNIVRNTNIDIDTSLRGAKALLHLGELDLNMVSGITNPQQVQVDNRNLGIHPDLYSMVSGLRLEKSNLGKFTLGMHGVMYRFARGYDESGLGFERYGEDLDVIASGATIDGVGIGGLDLFVEGDWFDYRSSDFFNGEEPRPGYALYGSLSAYPGAAVILLEAKRTRDTERINTFCGPDGYEVAVAPSLEYERSINEDSAAAVNSNDLWGARLRTDYALASGSLLPYLSVAAFRDKELGGLHFNVTPETIIHPVAGVQWFGEKVRIISDIGLRNDLRDASTELGVAAGDRDTLAHLDFDIEFPAGILGTAELAVAAERFVWGENLQQQSDFMESESSLSLHPAEKWTFILYQDYSDNPLLDTTGNLGEKAYGATEILFKPTTSTSLRLFVGAYKAGIRCAGGQCRNLPGFEGARISFSGSI